MTSKKPIHKQLFSPESPKKPKPKKTKKVLKNYGKQGKKLTGRVTALRSDGTVNVRINGERYNGVPTMETYDPRSVNDKVSILHIGPQYLVLGKIGSDDMVVTPTIFPTSYVQYSWGINKGLSDKILYSGGGRVGRLSERFPTTDSDYMARLALSYYAGSNPNLMNGPADLTKQIDFYAERSEWDEGYEGAANFTLFPYTNSTGLPADPRPGSLNYNTSIVPNSIDFSLEPGEMKIITLPDTWRNNIGAVTLDANTIRGFVIEPASTVTTDVTSASYHTYGILTTLTGGLRIFNPS